MSAQAARGVLSGALAVLLSLWAVPAYAADVEKIGDVEGDSAYGQAASDDNVTQFDVQASPVGAPGQDALSPSDPAVPEDPAAALGEGSPAEPAPEASVPAAQREGLVEEGGALYFYEGGRRVSGERQIDGSWYYFDPEDGGAAVRSGFAEIPDANLPAEWEGSKECYYDEDGRMVKGELCLDGDWYFLDPGSGAKSYGFALLDDLGVQGGMKWCYYGPFKGDGRMVKGEACVDGKWYYLDPGSGGVTYGFALLDDPGVEGGRKWVYYGPFMADGTMRYGEQCIDGGWYYLTPGSGAVDYEWALIPDGAGGSKWVYYGPYMGDGRMRYGKQTIDGEKHRFNMITGEVCDSYFKLYLDAGHGQGSSFDDVWDPGAIGSGYQEANLTSELVDLVAAECRDRYGLDVHVNKAGNYRNRQEEAQLLGCSTFVSVHFNSGGGSGVESYIHTNPHMGSAALQDYVHLGLVSGFEGSLIDRGQHQAQLAVCANRMPATLLEMCFIDNPSDMSLYRSHKMQLARFIAAAIFEASKDDACIQ